MPIPERLQTMRQQPGRSVSAYIGARLRRGKKMWSPRPGTVDVPARQSDQRL